MAWKPSWLAARSSCLSPEMKGRPCGLSPHQASAAASWRESAAFSGNRSTRASACARSASVGCISRQDRRITSNDLCALECSAAVNSPVRTRRAKALRISTGVHQQTTTSCLEMSLRIGVAGCWAMQMGTKELESQNAGSIYRSPRLSRAASTALLCDTFGLGSAQKAFQSISCWGSFIAPEATICLSCSDRSALSMGRMRATGKLRSRTIISSPFRTYCR